jgi:hypothetical protein
MQQQSHSSGNNSSFHSLEKDMSFNKFCLRFSRTEPPDDIDWSEEHVRNLRIEVDKLPEMQRMRLLENLTERAFSDDRLTNVINDSEFSNPYRTAQVAGKVYLRDLREVFTGLIDFSRFEALCENKYLDLLSSEENLSPLEFDIFSGILPYESYQKELVQMTIGVKVSEIIDTAIILLPEFEVLPGFKEYLSTLLPDEADKAEYKKAVYDFMFNSNDTVREILIYGGVVGAVSLNGSCTLPIAVNLARAIDILQINEITEENKFITLVGQHIEDSLRNDHGKVCNYDANSWLGLLPRDPDNDFKLIPVAQKLVKGFEAEFLPHVMDRLESKKLHSINVLTLANTIRNFISREERSSEEFQDQVRAACLKLLKEGCDLNRIRKLMKTLSASGADSILQDDELLVAVNSKAFDEITVLNRHIENFVDGNIGDCARLSGDYNNFLQAARFFDLNISELKALPGQIKSVLAPYHYMSDICARDPDNFIKPREDMSIVSKSSWISLFKRAGELFNEGRLQRSEIYARRAVTCMVAVPGLSREPLLIADLFNLRARQEKNIEVRSDWLRKELFLRMKNLYIGHSGLGSAFRSYAQVLEEKAARKKEADTIVKPQIQNIENISRIIENLNRQGIEPGERVELTKTLEGTLNSDVTFAALGVTREEFYQMALTPAD